MIIKLKASKDKETKRTFRYIIDKNEQGVSGSLYLNKEENTPNIIRLKLKIG